MSGSAVRWFVTPLARDVAMAVSGAVGTSSDRKRGTQAGSTGCSIGAGGSRTVPVPGTRRGSDDGRVAGDG